MRPPEAIRHLPDSTPCYVPGVGEVTLGMVRATEEKPALEGSWEATLRMWVRKATEHYLEDPEAWPISGAGPPGGRA